ncbi:MAG: hypothetical protein NZ744_04430 [Pirellulaceae bacterium]|nr:hypothetical protein [Pirellulaceae bacterium]
MNNYLVQYADNETMVHQWAWADSHLDAAANVLIDRGFWVLQINSQEK